LEQKSWHGFTGTCKLSYLDLVTNISRALISSKRNFGPGFLSFFPSLSPLPPPAKCHLVDEAETQAWHTEHCVSL
jgi:hypothetical protein